MDQDNYLDRSVSVNVVSVEVFFDAASRALPVFVDSVIAFERQQERAGRPSSDMQARA